MINHLHKLLMCLQQTIADTREESLRERHLSHVTIYALMLYRMQVLHAHIAIIFMKCLKFLKHCTLIKKQDSPVPASSQANIDRTQKEKRGVEEGKERKH